jgi:hypothetical protein
MGKTVRTCFYTDWIDVSVAEGFGVEGHAGVGVVEEAVVGFSVVLQLGTLGWGMRCC